MSMKRSTVLIAPMLTLGALALAGPPAMAAGAASAPMVASVSAVQASPAASGSIRVKNYSFQGPGTVASGAKITVSNQDSEAHTVTADKGGAFNVTIPAGSTATFTAPSTSGSFAFHCNFHGNMHGVLVVQGAGSAAPATPSPQAPAPTASSQMTHMPVGAPATGVSPTTSNGVDIGLVGEGGALVLAAGAVFVVRRRMTSKA